MYLLPFREKVRLMLYRLRHQAADVGTLDADALDHLRSAIRAEQIDLRLSCAGDVNTRGFMIQGVDHEPKAKGAVNYNHHFK